MMELATLPQQLNELPKQCVYALINNTDKKVLIGFTSNLVTALNRIINYSNNLLKDDWSKLEFRILEEIHSSNNLRIRHKAWSDVYTSAGFKHYKSFTAVSYRVRIDVLNDFRHRPNEEVLLYVKLISRGYRELIVGVFDDLSQAQEFCNKYYARNIVTGFHYAKNDLTKEFLKNE